MVRGVRAGWVGMLACGCMATSSPLPPGAGITVPPDLPVLGPPPPPARPDPPRSTAEPSVGPLTLQAVFDSVERHFPLIAVAEQERAIAEGQRLSAEGAFDTSLRGRAVYRDGTFSSDTYDTVLEQPLAYGGLTTFAGYRFGFGDYPVYQGGSKTAQGGEFRTGIVIPLLKDGAIDRRRAALRQAQLGESLADPVVRRAKLDAYRLARRSYTNWLAAGELYRIAEQFVAIARQREGVIRERFQRGAVAELDAAQAKQVLAEREGRLAAADQRFRQAAVELSLVLRDDDGRPRLPPSDRLPATPALNDPDPDAKFPTEDATAAVERRPELERFQYVKERAGVEMRLAQNQMQPGLNLTLAASQDVGYSKPPAPASGVQALDRTAAEATLTFDLPAQRREARGKFLAARAAMHQLLFQEQFTRDQIVAEVQTLQTILERDRRRIDRARQEFTSAERVAAIARDQYERGGIRLFELNSLEVNALDAQMKIVELLGDYHRTLADYRAALGFDRE